MNENQSLGFTPEQIKQQIIKSFAQIQSHSDYMTHLIDRLIEVSSIPQSEMSQKPKTLEYRVALMFDAKEGDFYLSLEQQASIDDNIDIPGDRYFVRWVSDLVEVEV